MIGVNMGSYQEIQLLFAGAQSLQNRQDVFAK